MPLAPTSMNGTPKSGNSLESQYSGLPGSPKSARPIMVAAIVVQKIAKPRKNPKKMIGTICPRLRGRRRIDNRNAGWSIMPSQVSPHQIEMAADDRDQHQRERHL